MEPLVEETDRHGTMATLSLLTTENATHHDGTITIKFEPSEKTTNIKEPLKLL